MQRLVILCAALMTLLLLAGCKHLVEAPILFGQGQTAQQCEACSNHGQQGDQGLRGDTGKKGDKGDRGNKGERGERGQHGERGERGQQGETGATGEQGLQGVEGNEGQKGEEGADGVRGVRGEKGDSYTKDLAKLLLFPLIIWGIRELWKHVLARFRAYKFINTIIGDLFPLAKQHLEASDSDKGKASYAGRPESILEQLTLVLNGAINQASGVLWKAEMSALNTFMTDVTEIRAQAIDRRELLRNGGDEEKIAHEFTLATEIFKFWLKKINTVGVTSVEKYAARVLLCRQRVWLFFLFGQLVFLAAIIFLVILSIFKVEAISESWEVGVGAGSLFTFLLATFWKNKEVKRLIRSTHPDYIKHVQERLAKVLPKQKKSPPVEKPWGAFFPAWFIRLRDWLIKLWRDFRA